MTRFLGRCDPVGWLLPRESIFKISHTGEFRGNREVATQTVGSHLPQTGGRRVYKEGAMESNGKERAVRLLGRPCLLGSLLQVWARTYRACPAWKAPPSGGSCLENLLREGCSGQWPRHLPAVTCKGNQVPFHGVLLSRGSLRSAGESTLTARATSAPFQQRLCLCRAASEKILQALGSTP